MTINRFTKTLILLITLTSIVACRSSSEEAATAPAAQTESGIDATTRRTQELAAERAAREAEAAERMRVAALNTKVFYFDFDVAEFRQGNQ